MKRAARSAIQRGYALSERGDLPAAIAQFEQAHSLDPDSDECLLALGSAWLEAGEPEKALQFLPGVVQTNGEFHAAAGLKAAEAVAMTSMARCPPGYVRHLFDQFSANYDRSMIGELGYRAPAILRQLTDMLLPALPASLDILDLGCGTGLAGEAFRDIARRMDGVDLSPEMIRLAAQKRIYDELTQGDIESFLDGQAREYDLLLGADTLVYFGDLAPVFRGVYRHLRPNGFFLFTAEKREEPGYGPGPKRRYQHCADYLRDLAAATGFDCAGILDCTPRYDAGRPVAGLAAAFRRA